jgi:hypothetical protein
MRAAAERLAAEWAARYETKPTPAEVSLAEHILDQLADPTSDCDALLEDICRARWTTPVPLRVVTT